MNNSNLYEDEDLRERMVEEKQELFEDLQEARGTVVNAGKKQQLLPIGWTSFEDGNEP